MYVLIYLLAIVFANMSAYIWGPKATIINSFLFIGLDITARDRLHEAWKGNHLVWKMILLILAGSGITYLINSGTFKIGMASIIAFTCAIAVDSIIYDILFSHKPIVKVNGSNVVSSAVDSLVFPTIAFGSLMPLIVIGQFAAKIAGGFIWSLIIYSWMGAPSPRKTE